ncbi:hypothetical protein DBR07_14285 [Aeromonas sp. HMWF036]|nr:hypothetical protein DBR07_14285 [Aeromonas sp. HMWF036]PTT27551.1 hypothetical protein DBR30_10860 [Aeromonas sp. HMWF017]
MGFTSFRSNLRFLAQHTRCLRVIHNAWHFYYTLILVIKVVCGGIGIAYLIFLGKSGHPPF